MHSRGRKSGAKARWPAPPHLAVCGVKRRDPWFVLAAFLFYLFSRVAFLPLQFWESCSSFLLFKSSPYTIPDEQQWGPRGGSPHTLGARPPAPACQLRGDTRRAAGRPSCVPEGLSVHKYSRRPIGQIEWGSLQMKPSKAYQSRGVQCKEVQSRGKQRSTRESKAVPGKSKHSQANSLRQSNAQQG